MFLSNFDLLSPEITLFYKGNERHSSIFSGIITILLFFFILFFSIFNFNSGEDNNWLRSFEEFLDERFELFKTKW